MTLAEDYLEFTTKWKREYGEKTLVLMQVGSFYEVYGLQDKEGKIYGSNIQEFAELNDMVIAKKSVCVGKEGVVMAGFGLPQLEKYVRKLQDNGYTVPVYTQDNQCKNTARSLHTIFSPGTYFSNETKELSNNITCIWLQCFKSLHSALEQIMIGIANIDIYTGKTSVFEFTNDYLHNPSTYDELERYISIYHPNECIIISNLDDDKIADIINFTSINSAKIHRINLLDETDMGAFARNAEKQIYQQEVVKRFYPLKNDETLLSNLQNYSIAIQSFIFLLDFTYRHNPNLVNTIAEPIFENYTSRLILANHSLKQLNIIPDNRFSGKFSCVSNLLNNCITPMGKRAFLYNLLNPTTDPAVLIGSYDITDYLLSGHSKKANETLRLEKQDKTCWQVFRTTLTEIRDIEKLRRKLYMRKITPKDFTILYDNIALVLSLFKTINDDKNLLSYLRLNVLGLDTIPDTCQSIMDTIEKNLDITKSRTIDDISQDKLGNVNIYDVLYIKKNLDTRIDNLYKQSLECVQEFECVRKYLSGLVQRYEKNTKTKVSGTSVVKVSDFVKINETAKLDSTLQVTQRRATFLKKDIDLELETNNSGIVALKYVSDYSNLDAMFSLNIKILEYTAGNSNTIITSSQIRELASTINTAKDNLISNMECFYHRFINKFMENSLDAIISFIINLDILQCKCFIAKEYNYCKPTIMESAKSFIDFTGIRHCLIEHLNTREIYVTNDLALSAVTSTSTSTSTAKETNGLLLYGTNAVGKTSFIKAIGIALIMAQAGLYVPASTFTFSPYNTLFTRILGNDNIFKGLSTFAVEMTELRTILQMADKNSLILGDELCSGTESDSALSIFVAGLEILHSKKCTFLFATHFHEVVKYDEIKALDNLTMFHMSVIFDKANNKLIYDRKLKPGPGESMYGLEVCKSLNLPDAFLNRAHDLRIKYNKMYKNVLSNNTSKYNAKKIRDICELCKSKVGTEVHHLDYQQNASASNNYIESPDRNFHKNHVANLINICEDCHQKLHKTNEKLVIKKSGDGYEVKKSIPLDISIKLI